MPHPELLIFFFLIALIYASVGFGGGSSYLALLALYALPFMEIRLTALLCNIIVVTGGTVIYIRHGQVDGKKVIPLVLASIPLAFLGAAMKLNQNQFFILLGISLVAASILLWWKRKGGISRTGRFHPLLHALLGGAIGFLSGMVGIGGGIFLSPLLNLMGWDEPKKIAATASLFILVNSVAGILGQAAHWPSQLNYAQLTGLCLAVLAGGQVGVRLGTVKFDQLLVRRVTAVLVFAAGMEVLWRHL